MSLGPSCPFGDGNGDGEVNAVDTQLVVKYVLGIPIDPSYNPEVNEDGVVHAAHIQLVIIYVRGIPVTTPQKMGLVRDHEHPARLSASKSGTGC